jgi:hypothetical protein
LKQNVLPFNQRIQQHLLLLEAKLPHLMPAQLMLPQQQLLMERARPPLMERQRLQEMEPKLLQEQLEMLRPQVEMKHV